MFRFWARMFCVHMENEIMWLREQLEHERQRAEAAIDELLRVRIQAGPVSTPRAPAETIVDRLLKDSEFTGAGELE